MIELRLRDISQLFNTLDPHPFRERDLDGEAEEYIVSWAQDIPKDQPIHIVVYLPAGGPERSTTSDVAHAITSWFAAKAQAESNGIRQLFRDGRLAFLIGLVVLSMCLFIAWSFSHRFGEGPFARILSESLVIIGWVVLWRPVEMLLYDWLPLSRRRKLFRRLATAVVTIADGRPTAPSIASS